MKRKFSVYFLEKVKWGGLQKPCLVNCFLTNLVLNYKLRVFWLYYKRCALVIKKGILQSTEDLRAIKRLCVILQ